PFLTPPEERAASEPRIWSALLNRVLRRPLASAIAAGGVLVVLGLPTLGITLAVPGVESLPQDLSVIKTYNRIQAVVPGSQIPAQIAVQADDVTALPIQAAIRDLQEQTAESKLFEKPVTTKLNLDRTVEEVDVPVAGDGTDSTSKAAVALLRDQIIP